MRVLITGGAGFIGSHLALQLLRQGIEVVTVDEKWKQPNLKSDEFSRFWNVGKFTKLKLDCRSLEDLDQSWSFDFVYHLASTVGVSKVLENPSACIQNNVESLKAVLALGAPGLFTSTSEVYGKNSEKLREDSDLVFSSAARWSYAASKLTCEWMAKQAGWKVVRLFNVVGPRQNSAYGAVLPQFVKQALSGEPITVYGDGCQIRTLMDVRDCVEILDKLRNKEFDVSNVGGKHSLSVYALALLVRQTLNSTSPIERIPYAQAYGPGFEECQSRVPDLSKLESLIGEKDFRPLQETILDVANSLVKETPNLDKLGKFLGDFTSALASAGA